MQMLFLDPPAHTRLRGLASQAFILSEVESCVSISRDRPTAAGQVESKAAWMSFRTWLSPCPALFTAEMLGVRWGTSN